MAVPGIQNETGSLLQIISFQSDHTEALIQLWHRCNLLVPWNNPWQDIERKMTRDGDWLLIGFIQEALVATVMAGYDGHRGWLNYLGVDPDFRRRGLAKEMVAAAVARLTAAGCIKINLQIRESNHSAVEFYRRIGFKTDPVMSMGLRLAPDDPYEYPDPNLEVS